MPRTNQQSSFTGCRLQPCSLPSSRALACSFILFICPLLLLFHPTYHSLSSSVSLLFIKLQSLCSTWHPKLYLLNVFLTRHDSAVVWRFLSTFILKWVSGMLPLQELFCNQHFAQKKEHKKKKEEEEEERSSLGPLHSALSSKGCWLKMFLLKGGGLGERCRAKTSR